MNQLPLLQINVSRFISLFANLLFCFSPQFELEARTFGASSQESPASLKIAFLNVNAGVRSFSAQFTDVFAHQKSFKLLDESLSQMAARGAGFENLFNLSLDEAKNLGSAIDCDFYLVVRSETVRRSSFAQNVYFESYAVIFLVSARTGKLIEWKNAYFENLNAERAERLLTENSIEIAKNFANKIIAAAATEKNERALESAAREKERQIVELSDAESALEQNYRIPLPYKNLRPNYPEAARRYEVEATVDVAVNLDEDGEVIQTEIVRWAGFDLDEETVKTVKKMHFRPALRENRPLPVRILLRYNFYDLNRKNEKQSQAENNQ